eukprot:g21877.t1
MHPDAFANSRYIINWGSNTAVTNMHLWVKMLDARKQGAKIVTIDPYRCKTAERSDWHIMPRVGTDAALALGLMHIIFRDGLADDAYLADYCLGGEQLRQRVADEYTPARVSEITGVSMEDIEQLAREYATTPPAAIRVNYGLQRHRGGGMAVRTISCLPAVIGAWRERAGGVLLSTSALFPLNLQALHRPDLIPPGTRTVNMVQLAEALHGELEGPPVDVLYVYNSNPAAVAPSQRRVLDGLNRDDLFTVVHELFATDTVDYADIVIPATSQLEHRDLHTSYGHHVVQWNEPCIQPLGESKCNTDVFRELAARLEFEDRLFQLSDEELARQALWETEAEQPAEFRGITVDRLRDAGPQTIRIPDNGPPYAHGGFSTPSGKCELYCPRMEEAGLDPLATYIPPAESRDSNPELASRYPIQLISPPSPHFLNSTFANVDSLKNAAKEPVIYLHLEDAAPREIADGAIVRIFNDRGSFQAAALAIAGTDFALWPQPDATLGERLSAFFKYAFANGSTRVVVIGSDSPTLPRAYVDDAFEQLKQRDTVIGPATDGGYYLIGQSRANLPIFADIEWSGPRVLSQTVERIAGRALLFAGNCSIIPMRKRHVCFVSTSTFITGARPMPFQKNSPKQSHLLIADDNQQNCELLEAYLSEEDYEFSFAYDGEQAIQRVNEKIPDLLLLDIMMPKLSGYEVCEQLKQDEKTRNIPILMVTALNKQGDIERAVAAGCDDFLTKPVNGSASMERDVQIRIGVAGAGKTRGLLAEYRDALRTAAKSGDFGRTLWLTPTRHARRGVLAALTDETLPVCFSPNVLLFSEFAEQLLRSSGEPAELISPSVRQRLIRLIIDRLRDEKRLDYFAPIAKTTGFLQLVDSFISELKREEIWPEHFEAAFADGQLTPKDRELALIYSTYQQRLLDARQYDGEGRFWSARDVADRTGLGPFADLKLVIVDGFTDFTRTQYELLVHLAGNAHAMRIALPLESPLERTDLFAKSQAACRRLSNAIGDHVAIREVVPEQSANDRPAFAHLAEHLFSNPRNPSQIDSADGIEIHAAAGPIREYEFLAGRIKQMLLSGTPADDIVLAFRSLDDETVDLVHEIFAAAGIPFHVESSKSLSREPVLNALFDVVRMELEDWPFERLLSVLRSGRFRPDFDGSDSDSDIEPAVSALAAFLRERKLHVERRLMLRVLSRERDHAAELYETAETSPSRRSKLEHRLQSLTAALRLLERLSEATERLRGKATFAGWTERIVQLGRDLGIAPRGDDPVEYHDRNTWDLLERLLFDAAHSDVYADDDNGELTLAEFHTAIAELLTSASVPAPAAQRGVVRVLAADSVRNIDVPHLFLAGLTESSFPSGRLEDCLYGEAERRRLNERGLALGHRTSHGQDEMLLFYGVVTRGCETLVLSYPELSSSGKPLFASPYLKSLTDLFTPESLPIEPTGELDPIPSAERILSVADFRRFATAEVYEGRPAVFAALAADAETAPVARNILANVDANTARFRTTGWTIYEGMIEQSALRKRLAERFPADHQFSATQLETYAGCGFRFLMHDVLKLDALDSPHIATDHLGRGTLVHKILALLHAPADDDTSRDDDPENLAETFRAHVVELLGKRISDTDLQRAIVRVEERLLHEWADFFGEQADDYFSGFESVWDAAPVPQHLELPFGNVSGEEDDTPSAPSYPPMTLGDDDAPTLVRGRIDRVDLGTVDGQAVFNVVDYKSGKPPQFKLEDVESGRSLQLALYTLAALQFELAGPDASPFQIGYWSLRESGFVSGLKGAKKKLFSPLDAAQSAALETTDVSIALSAGAGCGKTFVLTQRFLKYLESRPSDDPLAGIVAITFTDRAAREMRNRIRAACHQRLQTAASEDADYWLNILRSIDTARITTIHSFCASLLRSHAVDARLDPQFGLLEESLGDTFLRRTATDAMHNLLARHDEGCMELVLHYGLERTGEFLRKLVAGRFQSDPSRFADIDPERLAAQWLEHWHTRSVPLLLQLLADSTATRRLTELLSEHTPSHAEMKRRWQLLGERLPRLAQLDQPEDSLAEIRAAAQIQGGGGKKAWENDEIYGDVRDALSDFRKAVDKVLSDLDVDDEQVQEAARLSTIAMKVVAAAVADYDSGKDELGMLDFDDLLLKTRDLLRESESVRRRAAAGIDFLMIDEFQDTDPVQSEIVRHLCGDRLLSGKLFLVGDAKQSIYRFRRADPQVFESLRNEVPAAGRLPLSVNFRSQPDVLNFVNHLFAPAMGDDYEPLIPHVEQITPTPTIEFLFAQPDDDDGTPDTAEFRRRREADWIARRISGLLSDPEAGIRTESTETGATELRTARPGDITILFRTLSNVAIYEDALRRQHIPYYLVGGRAFFAQQEVADVANLCATLNDPDDSIALAGVLRSPFFNLTDESLYAMIASAGSLQQALDDPDACDVAGEQLSRLAYASEVLADLRQQKHQAGLAELLNRAIAKTGYDASLLNEHLGRRKLANLDKLIDMARQFDRSGMMTLSEFAQRIRDSIAEETHEELAATHSESGDVVRLMTVHQSKGLEFPVVIVADMDWTMHGGAHGATFHPDLGALLPMPTKRGETPRNLGQTIHRIEERQGDQQETTRVLYVATTRAADRLILSAGLKAGGRVSSPWLKLLDERFDLRTGLPRSDAYFGSVSGKASGDLPEILVHHKPPPAGEKADARRKRRVDDFRAAVAAVETPKLPAMRAPVGRQPGRLLQFSVSELLRADAAIVRPGWSPDPAELPPETAAEEPSGETPDARQLGNLVHGVIEKLDFAAGPPTAALIDSVARTLSDRVDDSLKQAATQRLAAFAQSDLFAEMASAKQFHRELDFLLHWPHPGDRDRRIVIFGQIDGLMQSADDSWTIVDYKTGGTHGKRPESVVDEYAIQLAMYAFAVEQFLGRPADHIEIATLRDTVGRFPFEFDAAKRTEFQNRIGAAIERLCDVS